MNESLFGTCTSCKTEKNLVLGTKQVGDPKFTGTCYTCYGLKEPVAPILRKTIKTLAEKTKSD